MAIMDPNSLSIYLVTHPVLKLPERSLFTIVERACAAGVSIVQYRDKDCDNDVFVEVGREIRRITTAYGVPMVVNDRVDTVVAIGADGVHVGQDDMPAAEIRQLLGPDAIVGVSVLDAKQAAKAESDGASYVAVNGVFATGTKELITGAVGLKVVSDVCRAVSIPVVGIGGINPTNAAEVIRAGACGVAVVTAITMQDDVQAAVQALAAAVRSGL
jgi:thiamine-phosphate pyrophosphorylase